MIWYHDAGVNPTLALNDISLSHVSPSLTPPLRASSTRGHGEARRLWFIRQPKEDLIVDRLNISIEFSKLPQASALFRNERHNPISWQLADPTQSMCVADPSIYYYQLGKHRLIPFFICWDGEEA